ncbi:MAG: AAA family ATPase [Rhodobacteraceae bacterium]|nr:AAA family ATPase [Paracoccaceae bacterium]
MNAQSQNTALFESTMLLPDPDAQERLSRLVGLDDQKTRLSKMLGTLINSAGLEAWASRYHPGSEAYVSGILKRPPLIVLCGDVGSGKTALAETIGDMVARQEDIEITLLPMSLSARGQGRVGEMTQLVSAAFEYAYQEASKLVGPSGRARGGVILLIDEADALAQSRESSQMHHEDKAGVNAFIRGIDRLSNGGLPIAVIMCTNRLSALDPAVKRRAAEILVFERPEAKQRHLVLSDSLTPFGLSASDIEILVNVTGSTKDRSHGFAFSDLTQRLIPSIILDAYPNSKVTASRAIQIATETMPTPPFQEKV